MISSRFIFEKNSTIPKFIAVVGRLDRIQLRDDLIKIVAVVVQRDGIDFGQQCERLDQPAKFIARIRCSRRAARRIAERAFQRCGNPDPGFSGKRYASASSGELR